MGAFWRTQIHRAYKGESPTGRGVLPPDIELDAPGYIGDNAVLDDIVKYGTGWFWCKNRDSDYSRAICPYAYPIVFVTQADYAFLGAKILMDASFKGWVIFCNWWM